MAENLAEGIRNLATSDTGVAITLEEEELEYDNNILTEPTVLVQVHSEDTTVHDSPLTTPPAQLEPVKVEVKG